MAACLEIAFISFSIQSTMADLWVEWEKLVLMKVRMISRTEKFFPNPTKGYFYIP